MRLIGKTVLAGALLLGSVQMASANVTTQQDAFGPSPTSWTANLNFRGFNPSLGTLTSVTVTVEELLTGSATVMNTSNGSASGSVSITDTAKVSFPGTSLPVVTVDTASTNTLAVNPGSTVGPVAVSNNATNSETTTTNLSGFDRTWTGNASDSSSIAANFGTANVLIGGSSQGEVIATVDYFYSTPTAAQISEPFSMAMLASGLLSLGMVRRRRRRQ